MKNSKAITLVALVITIVILLILAGISIQAITNTGLFANVRKAVEETKYANAEEKVKMAVMASYDENASLNKDLLKDSLNKIDGINPKVTEVTWDLKVNVVLSVFPSYLSSSLSDIITPVSMLPPT